MKESKPRQIKIGFVAGVSSEIGGVFQYSQSMLDALKKIPAFEIIVFTDSKSLKIDGHEVRELAISDNKILKIIRWLGLFLRIQSPSLLSKRTRELTKDIDYFVCPYISHFPHYWLKKSYVFTFHDLQDRYFPKFFSYRDRLRRWMLWRTVPRRANRIICESNFVKRDLINFLGISSDRIHVLPAPPTQSWLGRGDEEQLKKKAKEKYKLPENYLFYPAQFWPHKNHHLLLRSLDRLRKNFPDLKLILTGSKQNYYDQVMGFAAELGLQDAVIYPGYVSEEELMGIYLNALVMVMPSLFESISIPVYEAFALGVPVCCSNAVGLSEQVGDAGILFDPNSLQDLVTRLERLINNKKYRLELSIKGKQRLALMTHEKYAESIEFILRKMINE